MSAWDAFVTGIIILGFFATLAGLVVFLAAVAADIGGWVERRYLERHAEQEAPLAPIVPLEMHRRYRANRRGDAA